MTFFGVGFFGDEFFWVELSGGELFGGEMYRIRYNYSSEARSGKTKGVLELVDFSSWRELPTVSKLRYGHLAFPVSENQKKQFCGMYVCKRFEK